SRIRRACWASTRRRSISRGCWNASRIASRVISVNVTRLAEAGSTLSTSATWKAIASPSRSKSVARIRSPERLCAAVSSRTALAESSGTTYSGSNEFSVAAPCLLLSRSRMWPYEARTLYPEPRYRSSVFALVGDSTTTSVFAMPATFGFSGNGARRAGVAPRAGYQPPASSRGLWARTSPGARGRIRGPLVVKFVRSSPAGRLPPGRLERRNSLGVFPIPLEQRARTVRPDRHRGDRPVRLPGDLRAHAPGVGVRPDPLRGHDALRRGAGLHPGARARTAA